MLVRRTSKQRFDNGKSIFCCLLVCLYFNKDLPDPHARGKWYLELSMRLQRPEGRVSQLDVEQRQAGALSTGESVRVLLPQTRHRSILPPLVTKAGFASSARAVSRRGQGPAHVGVGWGGVGWRELGCYSCSLKTHLSALKI